MSDERWKLEDEQKRQRRLREYWRRRGYLLETYIEAVRFTDKGALLHCLRSDMVNGLPRRRA